MIDLKVGRTIVRSEDGTLGMASLDLPGMLSCGAPGEVAIRFEGSTAVFNRPPDGLELVDEVDPIPDPEKCGMGKGPDCCIFLVAGAGGFECARNGPNHFNLQWRKNKMTAQREPTAVYPNCMEG